MTAPDIDRAVERIITATQEYCAGMATHAAYVSVIRAELEARVPQGWQVAPCEPTLEMDVAGTAAEYAASTHRTASLVYRAMLAAAPSSQQEPK